MILHVTQFIAVSKCTCLCGISSIKNVQGYFSLVLRRVQFHGDVGHFHFRNSMLSLRFQVLTMHIEGDGGGRHDTNVVS